MPMLRRAWMLGLGLALAGAPLASAAAAQAPRINKPRPVAPGTPVDVPALPPASIDNTLAIGGDEVKAREDSTRLNVEVQINGRGPYRFVVDSGADTSAVGLRIARDLQLPVTTPAILNGMTSRELVDRVRVAQFTLGPSTFHNLEMPALREIDLGGDGLIGIDALVRQRLMMDFETHVIKVEDALKPIKYSPNDIVIRAKRERGQLILTEVRVNGLPVEAVIDTGSEITVGNLALRERLAHRRSLTTVDAIGVTGVTMKMELARIGELKLGPVLLRDIPIAFADVPPFKLFGLNDEPAILLGTDMLETFRRVSLDFRARKVRFQLRRCEVTGVVISTSPETFSKLSSIGNEEVCAK
jgi:predicted aspartyl protease